MAGPWADGPMTRLPCREMDGVGGGVRGHSTMGVHGEMTGKSYARCIPGRRRWHLRASLASQWCRRCCSRHPVLIASGKILGPRFSDQDDDGILMSCSLFGALS